MFAPKVAKAQTKAVENPAGKMTPERTIGNQATLRLLGRQTPRPAMSNPSNDHEYGGGTAENTTAEVTPSGASRNFGEIPILPPDRTSRSQGSSPSIIQQKFFVGKPDDPLKHEADRVGDQVMRMPAREIEPSIVPPQISRKCAACGADGLLLRKTSDVAEPAAAEAPFLVNEVLRSRGQPLDVATQIYFEPRFQRDFSRVRVHTDTQAMASAQAVQARAYTVGPNIVFGPGQYAPATQAGQQLLAHELTHVVQQNRGVAPSSPSGKDGSTAAASTSFHPAQGVIAQPLIQRAPLCPDTRDSGEVTKSQSQAGLLAVDTDFDAAKESLSVHDFSIDRDSVPPTTTQSDDWRRMMSMILGDPTTHVAVLGYSDCIGTEQNNQDLRHRRADAVIKAMPAEAQAKVSPMFTGWWGTLTYLFPNDTAENRARNRMVLIALMRAGTDSCDALPKATNIDQFIFLVSCLEKRLGLTNSADAPKTLSVLRQLYFGNAAWSTARNRSKIWDDIITNRPWAAGDDPTPKLGAKLLNALQDSKDIKFDSSASSIGIDISHLLTGLDAMTSPQSPSIHAAGPIYVQTNVLNHALATWAGDVASAATNYTICVDFLKFSASYDNFFKDLAEDADLDGDIDAYAVWAAQNSTAGAPVPLQLNMPISEILMQYYRLKNTPGGQGRATRFAIFANFYGADVKGKKMQNRLGFRQIIYPSVQEIAILSLAKQMKEVMQGNAASVGTCAGGKPPAATAQPASVDLGTLNNGVATASVEMAERFTLWLEKRL
jgi:outer membrane protein OmpA-like peptidoglycan-associated protein